ncbi:hypothetical protein [Spiroplasma endosymbiont of Zeiraphera isertana]|uniref:hypothetical protein n=1 Tax=Spiroplasma endosymbiont of Zeiraphera isertana TaxID=3066313 RepID=UPI00313F2AAB
MKIKRIYCFNVYFLIWKRRYLEVLYSKKSENLITEKEKTTTNSRKIKPQLPITTSLTEILLNNNEKLVGTITSDQYLNKDNKQVPLYTLIKSSEPNKKINIKAINSIKNDKQPTTILNKTNSQSI